MQITKEEIKNTTLKEIQQPTLPCETSTLTIHSQVVQPSSSEEAYAPVRAQIRQVHFPKKKKLKG